MLNSGLHIVMDYWYIWIISSIIWLSLLIICNFRINRYGIYFSKAELIRNFVYLVICYIATLLNGWLSSLAIILYVAKFVKYNL